MASSCGFLGILGKTLSRRYGEICCASSGSPRPGWQLDWREAGSRETKEKARQIQGQNQSGVQVAMASRDTEEVDSKGLRAQTGSGHKGAGIVEDNAQVGF